MQIFFKKHFILSFVHPNIGIYRFNNEETAIFGPAI